MLQTFQFIALYSAALFTGAAIYITVVEHPSRLACSTELAATVWAPSYQRATMMQASLAIISTAGGAIAWLLGGGASWLYGALCIAAVIPYTFLVVMPVNNALLDPSRDRHSEQTRQLLVNWGYRHAGRSLLSAVGLGIYIRVLLLG